MNKQVLKEIELARIRPIKNFRVNDVGDLTELMSSIKGNGLLQPIGVRIVKGGFYEIMYGNRRYV